MNTFLKSYNRIITKVKFFFKQLQLKQKIVKGTGRPLSISPEDAIALALFKQTYGIITKKAMHALFSPNYSYKTLVVNMNRMGKYALLILNAMMRWNQSHAHIVKHIDSTDIPVCLNKNVKQYKIMKSLSSWGYSGKGFYYGFKMSITTDLNQK